MAKNLNLKINKNLIEELNKRRGDLKLDEFILRILDEQLNSDNRINFVQKNPSINNEDLKITSSDMAILISTLQEFAKDIYYRLDQLEDRLDEQIIKSSTSNFNPQPRKQEAEVDIEKAGKGRELFTFPGEKGGTKVNNDVVFEITDDQRLEIDYNNSFSENDSEFEYGCPYCNATIPENASTCPNCGRRFDMVDGYGMDFTEVEPLSEGYDNTGRYDPRPTYVKRREVRNLQNESGFERIPQQPPMEFHNPSNQAKRRAPLCLNCGGEVAYIEDYKRWYCPRCNKYFGGPSPGNEAVEVEEFSKKNHSEPRQETKEPDFRPLKKYHRYSE